MVAIGRRLKFESKPGFCGVCYSVCNPERHESRLAANRARRAELRRKKSWCSVCTGKHTPTKHSRSLLRAKLRGREQRGTPCTTCRGPCNRQKHLAKMERTKAWKAKNKEQVRLNNKRWRDANPVRVAELRIIWLENNREWINEKAKNRAKRKYIPRYRSVPSISLDFYPYNSDHPLVKAANELVPKGLSETIRGDVCQEVILAMLEGRKPELDKIIGDIRKETQTFAKSLFSKDDYGRELVETLQV